jgi:hypothetical protein
MLSPDPIDDEHDAEGEGHPTGRVLPIGSRRAPDWLTGADEGLYQVEDPSREEGERPDASNPLKPVLRRPGAPDELVSNPLAGEAPATEPTREAGLEFVPAFEVVPTSGAGHPTRPEGAQVAGEAGDEADVRKPRKRKPRELDPNAPPPAWAPAASSVPVPKLVLLERPEAARDDPAEVASAAPRPLPGAAEDLHLVPPQAPAASVALEEPWWLIALDTLRTNRRVQLSAVAGLLGLVLVGSWLWPRGVGTTPISRVRRNPAQYDGRNLCMRGRVGDDVFSVGGGWAFYLLQGRDTIVTFTRSRTPKPHEVVTVKGLVSIGFLDGAPRQAMFEDDSTVK